LALGVAYGLLRSGRLIQQIGFQNTLVGFCVLVLLLSSPFPILSLRWWGKNANLESDDEEFQDARGKVRSTGYIAAASLLTFGSLLCLVLVLKFTRG
jgi:hypothetical protein